MLLKAVLPWLAASNLCHIAFQRAVRLITGLTAKLQAPVTSFYSSMSHLIVGGKKGKKKKTRGEKGKEEKQGGKKERKKKTRGRYRSCFNADTVYTLSYYNVWGFFLFWNSTPQNVSAPQFFFGIHLVWLYYVSALWRLRGRASEFMKYM